MQTEGWHDEGESSWKGSSSPLMDLVNERRRKNGLRKCFINELTLALIQLEIQTDIDITLQVNIAPQK